MPAPAPRLSRTPARIASTGPALDADHDAVLRDWLGEADAAHIKPASATVLYVGLLTPVAVGAVARRYSPAVTDPLLASLLMEHPFADDEGLLFTIDRSVTAGEARAAARTLADELRGLGVGPGSAVAVVAAQRSRRRHHDDRGLAGGRGVRAGEPALPGGRGRAGARRDRSRGHRPRRRCRAPRRRARVRPRRGVRDVDVGHDRRAEGDPAHARGVPRAARPRARAAPRRAAAARRPGRASRRPTSFRCRSR